MSEAVKSKPLKRAQRAPAEGSTIRIVSSRTGLAMETLRAWERRYGFPTPTRRDGSNRRLYSAQDVDRLIAIQGALQNGYRIGDVIEKSLGELEDLSVASKHNPNKDDVHRQKIDTGLAGSAIPQVSHLTDLLARDQIVELETQLRRGAVSLGPRLFVTELAHPFAVAVGQAWADGELSVRHEHLATECLVTRIRHMLAEYQDIEARPRVLLATLPDEPHTLPLQMVALYLVALGAKPRLLGGPTPSREIAASADALGTDILAVAVTQTCDRKQTRREINVLRKLLAPHVELWVGGAGAPGLGLEEDERIRTLTSWDGIDTAVMRAKERPTA